MKYYREEAEQVLSELGSSETGLTQDEAARRLAQNGRNRLETAKGKSLAFELFVLVGYICGITGKCISGSINWVFAIYILDLLMVATDILLTLRNRRLDKRKEAAQ